MKRHKSGAAALILVILTMATVLAVAVTSASRSTINLRDATYSTQGDQALACAEAGVEVALANISDGYAKDDTLSYDGKTQCNYSVEVSSYPDSADGEIYLPLLKENQTQQFDVEKINNKDITIYFKPYTFHKNVSLAVYLYKEKEMMRSMYHCPLPGASKPSSDFKSASVSGDECYITVKGSDITDAKYLRIRALYTDMQVRIENFDEPTGWYIVSKGVAGKVRRTIEAYKFYSQLPSAFDEAIVSFVE